MPEKAEQLEDAAQQQQREPTTFFDSDPHFNPDRELVTVLEFDH